MINCSAVRLGGNLFTWYVFASIRLTDNRLQSPILTYHAADVNRSVRDLLDLKFGCTTVPTLLRAECLRLYAPIEPLDSIAMRDVVSGETLLKQLQEPRAPRIFGLAQIRDDTKSSPRSFHRRKSRGSRIISSRYSSAWLRR